MAFQQFFSLSESEIWGILYPVEVDLRHSVARFQSF
jgi:hypothetical protein